MGNFRLVDASVNLVKAEASASRMKPVLSGIREWVERADGDSLDLIQNAVGAEISAQASRVS